MLCWTFCWSPVWSSARHSGQIEGVEDAKIGLVEALAKTGNQKDDRVRLEGSDFGFVLVVVAVVAICSYIY